ncbi:hypothetical protein CAUPRSCDRAFT_11130 [Caulochytrium protostelioides]|uniref:Uncharacterized protein n=1 Tax=Caulochytrium protostelioides TaxID=1555241 RepID=A0A4P9WV52_9FUNG|nr:hypothetical protein CAUPRSCDRAFT_11130 [Caulochytrium protostelioides]
MPLYDRFKDDHGRANEPVLLWLQSFEADIDKMRETASRQNPPAGETHYWEIPRESYRAVGPLVLHLPTYSEVTSHDSNENERSMIQIMDGEQAQPGVMNVRIENPYHEPPPYDDPEGSPRSAVGPTVPRS